MGEEKPKIEVKGDQDQDPMHRKGRRVMGNWTCEIEPTTPLIGHLLLKGTCQLEVRGTGDALKGEDEKQLNRIVDCLNALEGKDSAILGQLVQCTADLLIFATERGVDGHPLLALRSVLRRFTGKDSA